MFRKNLVLVWVAMGCLIAVPAMASAPQFSIMGGVNQSLKDVGSSTAALGYEGGLGANFMLSRTVGLDIEAYYLSVAYKTTTTTHSNYANIPVMLRLNLGRVLSLGAGGYYAMPISSGLESDYGYTGGARLSFPMGSTSFFLDGRYEGGLKDNSGFKTSAWAGLVGFTFGGSRYSYY